MRAILWIVASVSIFAGCAGPSVRSGAPSGEKLLPALERSEQPRGPRPRGYDRWYEPQWGPPYTVSNGYAWVYEPCRSGD